MKVTGKGQIYFVFLSTLSVRRATEGDILTQAEILAFLSTLSVRRATRGARCKMADGCDFYPRSP